MLDHPTPAPPIIQHPVAFHVYSRATYSEVNTTIPYENAYVNTGAINLTTGVFSAPYAGTYVFNFFAPRYSIDMNVPVCLNVRMDRNNLPVANGPVCGFSYEKWTETSLVAVLDLKQNDTIGMYLQQGEIRGDNSSRSNHSHTHFTGFLLNEKIAFHAFRTNDSFSSRKNETVPFHGVNTDVGSNFDLATSTFTAPVNGTYYFQFSGSSSITTDVNLKRNDVELMGYGYTRSAHWGSAGFHSLWQLQEGDKVCTRLVTGQLDEASKDSKITNLVGFLVAEEMYDSWNTSVYFQASRTSTLYVGNANKAVVNYTVVHSNEGSGMNAVSGIFKAPQPGIYAFHFTAHKGHFYISPMDSCSTVIQMHNNQTIGVGSNCDMTYSEPIFFHSILHLETGDEIKMMMTEGDLGGAEYYKECARFSGFLIYPDE